MPHTPLTGLDEIRVSDKLPSPSGVALEILRLTRDENAPTTQLAQVLTTDPALAGQMLKFANSAQVRTGKEARTINEAVVKLGLAQVRRLALGFSLLSRVRSGPCEAFDYNSFWTSCLATAVCGQTLSHRLRGVTPDEAFTCGLLGQIGRLCLASVHPEAYSKVLRKWRYGSDAQLRDLEQEAFSTDHDAITVALFEDWGLPESYREAVRCQDDGPAIDALPSRRQTLPRLLHLARQLAAVCAAPPPKQGALVQELLRRSSVLGLDQATLASGCEQALVEWQHMGQVLNVIVGDPPPIQELVARAALKPGARSTAPAVAAAPAAADAPAEVRADGLRILLVDGEAGQQDLLAEILGAEGHALTAAGDGQAALTAALQTGPQVIIADWTATGLSGPELCTALRSSPETAHTHVILLTEDTGNERLVEAFAAGADDYLAVPLNRDVLAARLRAAQRLIGLRERVERDSEEIRRFAAQQAVLNRKLQHMALHDELTGIGNRRAAMDHLQREWSDFQRHGQLLACMIIDIDHFKKVNDTYGHDAGDLVLKETARVLGHCLRGGDVVCRFGGEEFLAICPGVDLETAGMLGDRLRAAVEANAMDVPGFKGRVTVSVGVAGASAAVASITELLKLADEGLYAAKEAGRNKVCVVNTQPTA